MTIKLITFICCVFDAKYMQNATHLLKFIDYPLFSFNVGKVKPNPHIFKKMLKLAKVKPGEMIMIGNNKKDDIIPSKQLGINAIHYKNYKQLKKELKKFSVILD